ncbi:MAG: transposase [Bdellovibrionales bacterium]|nr:transposase [Bdellovibrionales bacterium]
MLKALPDGDHNSTSGLVAKNSGFSLHAGVATKAQEREKLEKICRYIARPALSEERLSTNVRGKSSTDSKNHGVMAPLPSNSLPWSSWSASLPSFHDPKSI